MNFAGSGRYARSRNTGAPVGIAPGTRRGCALEGLGGPRRGGIGRLRGIVCAPDLLRLRGELVGALRGLVLVQIGERAEVARREERCERSDDEPSHARLLTTLGGPS